MCGTVPGKSVWDYITVQPYRLVGTNTVGKVVALKKKRKSNKKHFPRVEGFPSIKHLFSLFKLKTKQ